MRIASRKSAAITTGIAVVAASAASLALSAATNHGGSGAPAADAATAATALPQATLAEQFRAFSGAPLGGDASFIPGVPDAQNQIDPGSVHLARSGPWRIAVATSGKDVCLSSVRAGQTGALPSTCAPESTVATAGLFLGVQPAPSDPDADATYYVGLLPNGISSVRVTDAGGATTPLTVSNNIMAGRFSSPPRKLQFTDAGGAQHSQALGADNKGTTP